jgi:hypothetical protein
MRSRFISRDHRRLHGQRTRDEDARWLADDEPGHDAERHGKTSVRIADASIATPALNRAKTGTMPNASHGCTMCSKRWIGELAASSVRLNALIVAKRSGSVAPRTPLAA